MNNLQTQKETLINQFSNLDKNYRLSFFVENSKPTARLERISKKALCGYKLLDYKYADTDDMLVNFFNKKLETIQADLQKKEEELLDQKKQAAGVKTGDMFYSSWGYDQTNIDFYIVVEKTSSQRVVLQQVGTTIVSKTGWCANRVKIDKTKLIGETIKKALTGNAIKLASFMCANKFDDENKTFETTSYA